MRERCLKVFVDGLPHHCLTERGGYNIIQAAYSLFRALEGAGFDVSRVTIGDNTIHNPNWSTDTDA